MRFLHTADWHLGRIFHGTHLTDEQALCLDQLCAIARDARPDALLVAGDVYDRAVPPPEAVRLLDDTLSRLVLDLRLPIVLIAGNHDSPERIGFASRLLAERNIRILGAPEARPLPLRLHDSAGPVDLFLLPYAEPAMIRQIYAAPDAADPGEAMKVALDAIRSRPDAAPRRVLIGHAYVRGGSGSESERPLSIGGSDAVDAGLFHGFDLVALGHLHRSQSVGGPRIHYAGALMNYAFSEAAHEPGVSLIELNARSEIRIERLPLVPRKRLRIVEGFFDDLLRAGRNDPRNEDFIMARLLDRDPVLDVMGRLREAYPNLLHIERARAAAGDDSSATGLLDPRRRSEIDLFAAFYRDMTREDLDERQRAHLESVVAQIRRDEREAGS